MLIVAALVPWIPVLTLSASGVLYLQGVLLTCREREQAGATDRECKGQATEPKCSNPDGKMGRAEVNFSGPQCCPPENSC